VCESSLNLEPFLLMWSTCCFANLSSRRSGWNVFLTRSMIILFNLILTINTAWFLIGLWKHNKWYVVHIKKLLNIDISIELKSKPTAKAWADQSAKVTFLKRQKYKKKKVVKRRRKKCQRVCGKMFFCCFFLQKYKNYGQMYSMDLNKIKQMKIKSKINK